MALDAALLELTARELKQRLADARIDKIFEPTRRGGAASAHPHGKSPAAGVCAQRLCPRVHYTGDI